ncbi:MAG TPA: hypothetical protein VF450_07655 [Noviherbaspirillum sp.]
MTPLECWEFNIHAVAKLSDTGVCSLFEKEYVGKFGSRVPILSALP